MKNWKKDKETFEVRDVRSLKGNFLPGILKKAEKLEVGQGLCVIQSFEPIPLYSALGEMGFEYETEKVSEIEYKVFFHRNEKKEKSALDDSALPFKPTAIVNFNTINPKFADNVVNMWQYIWGREDNAIDMRTRLLLSLANGVGAGRMRQAVREFIKAYSLGVTTSEFDEIFAMFAWNQGVGFFASEIGPSALFAAYKLVKTHEEKGVERAQIIEELMEQFGENNSNVSTFYKKSKND